MTWWPVMDRRLTDEPGDGNGEAGGKPIEAKPPTPEQLALHVDHAFRDLLRLGRAIEEGAAPQGDDLWRALRTAYAALFRAVMEFLVRRPPGMPFHDIEPSAFVSGLTQLEGEAYEHDRMRDADKLLAHLSEERIEREGDKRPEWGTAGDREMVLRRVRDFLSRVPEGERVKWFPETVAELRRCGVNLPC